METSFLYTTDDDPAPKVFASEEPFHAVFACDPSLPESICLSVSNADAHIVTSDRVEVRYILHLDAADMQLAARPFTSQVTPQPAPEEEPGILMCFTQPGETVWELARRYRVSPDALRRMNPAFRDGAQENQRVILWKR